jgi:outer membrane protein
MDESNEGKRISAMLNEKNESFKKQLAEKRQELMSLEEEIKKQSMMLSLDAQENKRREYETKARNYQMLVQKLSGELQKAENQAKKDFIKGLYEVAQKIAQQEGFDLILDGNVGVIYALESFNITDKIIYEYNILKP